MKTESFSPSQPDVGVGPSHEAYEEKYRKAVVTGNQARKDSMHAAAERIRANRSTYAKVESETGVPWWWIGVIHLRESSFDFRTWLANGDSLNAPTWRVPAGLRGAGSPPWSWHEGAVISLKQMHYHKENFSTLGRCLRLAEAYNGWGYWSGKGRDTIPPNSSPYIWSGTDQYRSGKYVADGVFDPHTVDVQLGVVCVMKALESQGVELFPQEIPKTDKVTWIEFYRKQNDDGGVTSVVVGMNGPTLVEKLETNSTKELLQKLQSWNDAGSFLVAPPGKTLPTPPSPNPEPTPVPPKPEPSPEKTEPVIKLTKHPSGKRSDGLIQLHMEFYDDRGVKYGQVLCVSGVPSAQVFRTGKDSRAGSLEPLPEGVWSVGNIEWISGKDSYVGSWGSGLGPVWVGMTPLFSTSRSAIGMHRDDGGIGTAGCVGISSTEDLKELVRLLRLHDPQRVIVDYNLGTIPKVAAGEEWFGESGMLRQPFIEIIQQKDDASWQQQTTAQM